VGARDLEVVQERGRVVRHLGGRVHGLGRQIRLADAAVVEARHVVALGQSAKLMEPADPRRAQSHHEHDGITRAGALVADLDVADSGPHVTLGS
jgi:hypothetical protein